MEKEGGIDRFNKEEQKSLRKYENYIDLETANYTDARNVVLQSVQIKNAPMSLQS